MSNKEEKIWEAIRAKEAGEYLSFTAAAQAYNVDPSSLFRRKNNTGENPHLAHWQSQRLPPSQEKILVEWILHEQKLGHAPSRRRVREMARFILEARGDEVPLGKNWLPRFLKRNPAVKSIIGQPIESCRANQATPNAINDFLDRYERIRDLFGIQLRDTYNMDETGLNLGSSKVGAVIADSSSAQVYVKAPPRSEWVSIIECVSAAGEFLRPVTIFKGKSMQSSWFPFKNIPDWFYTVSENGWTSNEIGVWWLHKVFIPETISGGRPQMLVLDNHSSHVSVEFLWLCYKNNIQLVFLPPHASHILQPLDLSCFAPLKEKYRSHVKMLSRIDNSAPVKKEKFITVYDGARREAFVSRNIRSGWAKAGMAPFDRTRPLSHPKLVVLEGDCESEENPALGSYMLANLAQDGHQMRRQIEAAGRDENREMRALLRSIGNHYEEVITECGVLQAENADLKQQNSQLQPRKRRRVQVDANERFASMADIEVAVENSRQFRGRTLILHGPRPANSS